MSKIWTLSSSSIITRGEKKTFKTVPRDGLIKGMRKLSPQNMNQSWDKKKWNISWLMMVDVQIHCCCNNYRTHVRQQKCERFLSILTQPWANLFWVLRLCFCFVFFVFLKCFPCISGHEVSWHIWSPPCVALEGKSCLFQKIAMLIMLSRWICVRWQQKKERKKKRNLPGSPLLCVPCYTPYIVI